MYYVKQRATSPNLEGVVTERLGVFRVLCPGVALPRMSLQLFHSRGAQKHKPLVTKTGCPRDVPYVDCAYLLSFVCQDN